MSGGTLVGDPVSPPNRNSLYREGSIFRAVPVIGFRKRERVTDSMRTHGTLF